MFRATILTTAPAAEGVGDPAHHRAGRHVVGDETPIFRYPHHVVRAAHSFWSTFGQAKPTFGRILRDLGRARQNWWNEAGIWPKVRSNTARLRPNTAGLRSIPSNVLEHPPDIPPNPPPLDRNPPETHPIPPQACPNAPYIWPHPPGFRSGSLPAAPHMWSNSSDQVWSSPPGVFVNMAETTHPDFGPDFWRMHFVFLLGFFQQARLVGRSRASVFVTRSWRAPHPLGGRFAHVACVCLGVMRQARHCKAPLDRPLLPLPSTPSLWCDPGGGPGFGPPRTRSLASRGADRTKFWKNLWHEWPFRMDSATLGTDSGQHRGNLHSVAQRSGFLGSTGIRAASRVGMRKTARH